LNNDEHALVTALKQRDPDALSQVFTEYSNKIYRLAMSLLNDEQQADGVVQETFLALIQHIDTFEGRAKIGTWLYRVAYNECMMRIRKAKPSVDLTEIDEHTELMPTSLVDWQSIPEIVTSSHEAFEQMNRAIATLSPPLKAVFILRDVEELSTRETAQSLEISESVVKVRLHRARLLLREQLSAYFEERVTK